MNGELPERRRPAHPMPVEVHRREIVVFVTVCAKDRQRILATEEVHHALRAAWQEARHWQVGRYAVLPDHLHLFCAPGVWPPESLRLWVRYWKRLVTQALGTQAPQWQSNFWDTQLRGGESYAAKWEYVHTNAVRHGLVAKAENWPFQGQLHELVWREP